ncbi:MAG: septum formation initiator family protein [Oscillospiraceae bacterium]
MNVLHKGKKIKKSFVFRVCVLVFSCYICGCLINLQIDITNKKNELLLVREQIQQQHISNNNLERLLNSDEDDEYIEKLAREKLGFAYPDEKVYIDISGN